MYDKRDDFDFDIVNFPFLDGDVPGGLGLDDMSFAWPAVVQLLVFIYSGIQ